MKILEESFTKGGGGHVRLVPDDAEDMWQLYNLLRADDHVECVTFRKVTRGGTGGGELGGGGGGGDSERVRVKLRVHVETIEYDGDGEAIRVKGRNTSETEHVKLGAYHTLDVDVGRAVKIEKPEWDAVDVARLREAADPAASADLAVLLITEGLANLALVGASVTVYRAKVEKAMPRKRGAAAMGYDKALETFHKNVFAAVERHVDFQKIKCLVVAGPGFAKDTFLRYLELEAVRRDVRPLVENKSRIVEAHASSAFKGALREVLETPAVMAIIKDTKAAEETRALDDFFETLAEKPDRALYGPAHVFAAHELGAVETLLITDALFRTPDAARRRRWVALTEEVEKGGGKVHVFSSAHASGAQLGEITGVAATLRFPLPDLVDAELPPPF